MINKPKLSLKEKDIVEYIVNHWEKFFNQDIFFYKKEYRVHQKWRCDILGYKIENINNSNIKVPIYIEVKYNKNHRDLIYEFSKGKEILEKKKTIYNDYLMLIIDKKSLDSTTINFLENNQITYYVYDLQGNDLNTLSLTCVENFLN